MEIIYCGVKRAKNNEEGEKYFYINGKLYKNVGDWHFGKFSKDGSLKVAEKISDTEVKICSLK